jgi:predicted enzyme related to lactoylglutathione lyase
MSDPIVHFEIAGSDDSKLKDFYESVFGWALKPMGPGYTLLETPEASPNGAIREAEEAELTVGVGVDDLDASLAAAAKAGGTVVMPATDNGHVKKGQIADPAGNVLTLTENTKPE